jgi:hypothetical protein
MQAEKQALSATSVDRIVMQLQRIADALELISGTQGKPKQPQPEYADILAKVSARFGDKREPFAKLVHENASKHPKQISEILKSEGILAPSTYWRDVKVLRDMEQSA